MRALEMLNYLGAIDDDGNLTPVSPCPVAAAGAAAAVMGGGGGSAVYVPAIKGACSSPPCLRHSSNKGQHWQGRGRQGRGRHCRVRSSCCKTCAAAAGPPCLLAPAPVSAVPCCCWNFVSGGLARSPSRLFLHFAGFQIMLEVGLVQLCSCDLVLLEDSVRAWMKEERIRAHVAF